MSRVITVVYTVEDSKEGQEFINSICGRLGEPVDKAHPYTVDAVSNDDEVLRLEYIEQLMQNTDVYDTDKSFLCELLLGVQGTRDFDFNKWIEED